MKQKISFLNCRFFEALKRCLIFGQTVLVICLPVSGMSASFMTPGGQTAKALILQNLSLRYNQIDASKFPAIVSFISVNDDSGYSIGDLTENNFQVYEDGIRELPIQVEELTDSLGITVVLVIDRSTSMKNKPIEDAKNAASAFVQLMNSQDEAAVVSFGSSVRTDHDFSQDKASLTSAIANINAKGGTAIFDALIHSANLIKSKQGRRAIILLTDGHDKDSKNSFQAAMNYVVPLGIPVFTIGLNLGRGSQEEKTLQDIATGTRGKYYRSPSSSDLEAIYKAISALLHHVYRITYTTHNPARDGTLRHVRIDASVLTSMAGDTASYRAPLDLVTFAATTKDIPAPARDFTLTIEIPPSSYPIYHLQNLQFKLIYDSRYLRVKQPYNQTLLASPLFGGPNDHTLQYTVDPQKGEIQITLSKKATSGLINGTGPIAQFTFTTIADLPDAIPLQFKIRNLQAFNEDQTLITTETRDLIINTYGYVTVALSTEDLLSPGKVFRLNVEIPADAKYLPGLKNLSFSLKYDPAYLKVKEPQNASLLAGKLFGNAIENNLNYQIKAAEGLIVIALQKKEGFPRVEGRGQLVQITFAANLNLPDSTKQEFKLTNVVASDDQGWMIPIRWQDLTVYSYGLIVWPGDTNQNGRVELSDVNVLGVYWSISGPGRPAEPDPMAWKPQFSGRYPVKRAAYADADGSGQISERDLIPIGLNWGQQVSAAKPFIAAKRAPKGASALKGAIRATVSPTGEKNIFWIHLNYPVAKSLVCGLTFRLKYPGNELKIREILPGKIWPSKPLLFVSNPSKKGILAVGLMQPAGVSLPKNGEDLMSIKVQTAGTLPVSAFQFADVALVTADGQVHEMEIEQADEQEFSAPTKAFNLFPAYPNPFNPATTLRYALPQPGEVYIRLYNSFGQLVDERRFTYSSAGTYTYQWGGTDRFGRPVGAGIYFVKISAILQDGHQYSDQQKLTFIK